MSRADGADVVREEGEGEGVLAGEGVEGVERTEDVEGLEAGEEDHSDLEGVGGGGGLLGIARPSLGWVCGGSLITHLLGESVGGPLRFFWEGGKDSRGDGICLGVVVRENVFLRLVKNTA
jgi:hypothetical protein